MRRSISGPPLGLDVRKSVLVPDQVGKLHVAVVLRLAEFAVIALNLTVDLDLDNILETYQRLGIVYFEEGGRPKEGGAGTFCFELLGEKKKIRLRQAIIFVFNIFSILLHHNYMSKLLYIFNLNIYPLYIMKTYANYIC